MNLIDKSLDILEYLHDHLRGRQKFSDTELSLVRTYHANYSLNHRTDVNCAETTGLSLKRARRIRQYLFEFTDFGGFLNKGPRDQQIMFEEIKRRMPGLTTSHRILEIGPGGTPIFPRSYDTTLVDKNAVNNIVHFAGHVWAAQDGRPILPAAWETLKTELAIEHVKPGFDLIVSSHCFEHVHAPIMCLRQCLDLLNPGGHMILFVPDGLAAENPGREEPTHTLYLTPEMVSEFLDMSQHGSDRLWVKHHTEPFRSTHDIVVHAEVH